MSRFFLILGLLAVGNGYIALRFIHRSPWAARHVGWVIAVACLFYVLQLIGPLGEKFLFGDLRRDYPVADLISVVDALSFFCFGLATCLGAFTLVTDVAGLLWQRVQETPDFDRRALLGLGAVTVGSMVLGVRQAVAGPRLTPVDIPLAKLPPALDGLRILQLSDLHVGPLIKGDYVERVVRIAESWQADLVVLTGDFVDGTPQELRPHLAPLSRLRGRLGQFYVTGNHEFYWGGTHWNQEFQQLGFTPLINEHVRLTHQGSQLILAGVSDYASRLRQDEPQGYDPVRALEGAPDRLPKILLSHQPGGADDAEHLGVDLMLSGHTHGGQYFPFNLLIGLIHSHSRGLSRQGDLSVYVNSGTGFWGPPLRTGVPAEITAITLRSGASA